MLLKREGWPDDEELVICTITGIQPHSVFARLDEYDKTGLIHISEIAPGRVRNIREYVEEGKKVVCKILRTDKERGHIDLSLRRVNEKQRRLKLNAIKQELLCEKMLEQYSFKNKLKVEDVYNAVTDVVFKKYPALFDAFRDAADGKVSLEALGVEKKLATELTAQIAARFVTEDVAIKGDLQLHTTAPNGVVLIREALQLALSTDEAVAIVYLGNGIYHITVTAEDYKAAEKLLTAASDAALDFAKKNKITAQFDRKA